MLALLGSVWIASFVGSVHCAAMCGGFVCFYSGTLEPGDRPHGARRMIPHAAYNAGRLASYAALGAIAGMLGAGLDRVGAAAGVGRAAAVVAGIMMVVWGGFALGRALGVRSPRIAHGAGSARLVAGALRAVRDCPPALRALSIGALSTLLPCGWLYAFAATAAATASPWSGAAVMAAFWAGTLPIMTALGVSTQNLFGPLRRRLPAFGAAALIAIGLLTLGGRLPVRSPAATPAQTGAPHACH